MLDILSITGPIFICIAVGYLTTRAGWFAKAEVRTLGKFVFQLALPALLFNTFAQRQITEILNASYLVAYAAGSLAVLALGWFWSRRVQGLGVTESAIRVLGMSCANSGYVGYPIMLLTFAPVAGVILALNMVVENVLMIPLLLALAERGRGQTDVWHRMLGETLKRLATNPLIIGLTAGVLFSLTQWHLPVPFAKTVSLFAVASTAVSLFVIGGSLVGLPFEGILGRVLPVTVGKLIAHPLFLLAALALLPLLGLAPLDPTFRAAAVLSAAMPMVGIYPVLAQPYKLEDVSAAALLVTTALSFFTLTALLWVLHTPL